MALTKYEELNPMHMDVLKEIGNIGSGNAATALSSMLSREVDMHVPVVQVLDYSDAIEFLGGPENVVVGMLVRITGDIEGMIMFILQSSFAETVINAFFGIENPQVTEMDETQRSAITEIGNIMAGSYVGAISSLSGMFINISVPSLTVDMVGAILSVPAIEFAAVSDKVLFIDESFVIGNQSIRSNMILIPEIDSLAVMLKRLGVEI